jgi:predicted dehydrogenase
MKELGFGLVGAGGMGNSLLRGLKSVERTRLIGIYDSNFEATKKTAETFNTIPYKSLKSLLASNDIDAVIIATPPDAHAKLTFAAAKAGKHVFSEKPLAVNTRDCDAMIAVCEEAEVALGIGLVLRYIAHYPKSKEILDTGILGKPLSISVVRTGNNKVGFSHGWRSKYKECGGALMEINAHEIDYMRWLAGEPESVFAVGGNAGGFTDYPDYAVVTITFQEGACGVLRSSLCSPIGELGTSIQCTNGNMVHGGFSGELKWETFDGKSGSFTREELGNPNAHECELRSFVEYVLDSKPMFCTPWDGRQAVAIAEAAYKSISTGKVIKMA